MPAKQIQEFEFPAGIQMPQRSNFRQREGYEVSYLKDDDMPRYRYSMVLSAARIRTAMELVLDMMPPVVSLVIEESKLGGRDGPRVEVWASAEMRLDIARQVWNDHHHLFVHDAMVGIGLADSGAGLEVSLDCHKILYIYSAQMEPPEKIVQTLNLTYFKRLPHISDLGYAPLSLRELDRGEDYAEVLEELRTELGLDLAEVREGP